VLSAKDIFVLAPKVGALGEIKRQVIAGTILQGFKAFGKFFMNKKTELHCCKLRIV